jgi:hypothetical protein
MKLKFISAQSINSSSVLQPSILDIESTSCRIKYLERRAGSSLHHQEENGIKSELKLRGRSSSAWK